jgi:hypothetical protein
MQSASSSEFVTRPGSHPGPSSFHGYRVPQGPSWSLWVTLSSLVTAERGLKSCLSEASARPSCGREALLVRDFRLRRPACGGGCCRLRSGRKRPRLPGRSRCPNVLSRWSRGCFGLERGRRPQAGVSARIRTRSAGIVSSAVLSRPRCLLRTPLVLSGGGSVVRALRSDRQSLRCLQALAGCARGRRLYRSVARNVDDVVIA